jgi:hypothetical protein
MNTLSETALNYAACGWAVFPCQPQGKAPVTCRALLDATTDAAQIQRWWRSAPTCNIGVATGEASKFFALDIDGDDGEASLRQLEAEHGKLPATLETITGKGRHCYFNINGHHIRNSVSAIGAGLDIRGSGGYVLAPPSVHPTGRPYAWSVDGAEESADAPDWLLQKINAVAGAVASASAETTKKGRSLQQWHRLLTNPIPSGQRNATLTSICGKLLHGGLIDVVLLFDSMLAFNLARCEQPLSDSEIETIVTSVVRGHLRKVDGHA